MRIQAFKKGWWVIIPLFYAWFVYTASTISLPSEENPIVFYSNQTRQDLKLLFSRAIQRAKSSIFLSVYGITDKDILNKLKARSQEGLSIHIEFDPTASCPLHQHLPKTQLFPIKQQGLMHRKIALIDDTQVFLGSANLTTASLRHHDNLIIGLYHPELSLFLKNPKSTSFSFSINETQKGELFLLPDSSQQGLKQLIATIHQAKKTLRIAMFTLTHPHLNQAIAEAKNRGIDVKIAIDYFTAKGASRKSIQFLYDANIPIFLSQGKQLLHHKWAYVDEEDFILGSANWTKSAFTKNQDFLLFLYSLNKQQKAYINSLWDVIETESQLMLQKR